MCIFIDLINFKTFAYVITIYIFFFTESGVFWCFTQPQRPTGNTVQQGGLFGGFGILLWLNSQSIIWFSYWQSALILAS